MRWEQLDNVFEYLIASYNCQVPMFWYSWALLWPYVALYDSSMLYSPLWPVRHGVHTFFKQYMYFEIYLGPFGPGSENEMPMLQAILGTIFGGMQVKVRN